MRTRTSKRSRTRLGATPLLLLGLTLAFGSVRASAQEVTLTISDRALAAIELPYAAIELRAGGVPAPEVRTVIVEARRAELPVTEVIVLFDHSVQYVYVHGPVPGYGSYVGLRLGEGLRGPRLYRTMRGHYRSNGHHPPGWAKGRHRRWHPHGHYGGRPHGVRVGGHRGARGHRGGRHRGARGHRGGRGHRGARGHRGGRRGHGRLGGGGNGRVRARGGGRGGRGRARGGRGGRGGGRGGRGGGHRR